jgi:hypothetical protein
LRRGHLAALLETPVPNGIDFYILFNFSKATFDYVDVCHPRATGVSSPDGLACVLVPASSYSFDEAT